MAEGWARHLRGDVIDAYSAGVMPFQVSQRTIEIMAETDVDISGQYSKHIYELTELDFDYVITLCDNAKQYCPAFPGKAKVIHRSFDDPTAGTGSSEEVKAQFRRVRDEIKAFVRNLAL